MTVLASGVILFRRAPDAPQVLLLRNRDNGHWGLPKGRRAPDDRHEIETALREVEEETGWTGLALERGFREVVEYVVRGTADDGRRKRVVYFLAEAPGAPPRLSPEHDAWRWATPAECEGILAYGKLRDLVAHALAWVDGHPPP